MVKNLLFLHKGLEGFAQSENLAGIQPSHARKLKRILLALSTAQEPRDLNVRGYDWHELKGNKKSTWSVKVDGNWRVTFKFDGRNFYDINYEDYH